MRTVTYKCDKCKRESTKENDLNLQEICIGTRSQTYSSYSYGYTINPYRELSVDWCEECREKMNIGNKKKEESAAPITIEDLIREIVVEVISASGNNQ